MTYANFPLRLFAKLTWFVIGPVSNSALCSNTRLLAQAQAETMWTMALSPGWRVPRNDLPSIATTSPAVSFAIEETQARNPFSNSSGSSRKHPVKGVVRGNAGREPEKSFQPIDLGLSILFHVPTLGPAQHRGDGNQQNLIQQVFPVAFHPRIFQLGEIPQGILHIPFLLVYDPLAYSKVYASALLTKIFFAPRLSFTGQEGRIWRKGPTTAVSAERSYASDGVRSNKMPDNCAILYARSNLRRSSAATQRRLHASETEHLLS